MATTDTHDEARRAQIAAHRSMSGSERVALVFEMTELARELTRSGIRTRHPDWDEQQVGDELIRRLHGPELAAALFASRRARSGRRQGLPHREEQRGAP